MSGGPGTLARQPAAPRPSAGARATRGEGARPRLALLVNIVAPYRVPVYRAIARHFDTHVVVSGAEGNRSTWDDAQRSLPELKVSRAWGVTLHWTPRGRTGVFDHRYLHLNPGYLPALLRIRPRVVVTNELGLRTFSALLYGALFRVPVFVWWGGTPHTERARGGFRRALRRVAARWVRHWISYGQTSTEYLDTLGVPRERVLQIQNCVDDTLFRRPQPPAVEPGTRPAFLFVGQLIERKGVGVLLRTAARLQREGRRFSLTLVGDGPERERCRALIAELGLNDVEVLPAQPPARMPAVYRSADVLVFPTAEDVWGLVVNEALWSGLQVIASRHAGCAPELLPPDHLFDPATDEFADVWRAALDGRLSPADPARLWTAEQVGDTLVRGIARAVGADGGAA